MISATYQALSCERYIRYTKFLCVHLAIHRIIRSGNNTWWDITTKIKRWQHTCLCTTPSSYTDPPTHSAADRHTGEQWKALKCNPWHSHIVGYNSQHRWCKHWWFKSTKLGYSLVSCFVVCCRVCACTSVHMPCIASYMHALTTNHYWARFRDVKWRGIGNLPMWTKWWTQAGLVQVGL